MGFYCCLCPQSAEVTLSICPGTQNEGEKSVILLWDLSHLTTDFTFNLLLPQDPLKIHYENNSPFLTITSMTRVIEVSHWGNIAVEETVDLKHTGANLKGPFSRYDYQRQPDSGISSVKSFKVRNGGRLFILITSLPKEGSLSAW